VLLRLSPAAAICAIMLSQNYFPEPNQHKLDYTVHDHIPSTAGDYTDVCMLHYITRGVSHYCLAIHIKKYLKAKGELWKFKYFTMQKCNLQKNTLKRNQILQDIITL
jgi:hypothetical protein